MLHLIFIILYLLVFTFTIIPKRYHVFMFILFIGITLILDLKHWWLPIVELAVCNWVWSQYIYDSYIGEQLDKIGKNIWASIFHKKIQETLQTSSRGLVDKYGRDVHTIDEYGRAW